MEESTVKIRKQYPPKNHIMELIDLCAFFNSFKKLFI